MTFTTKTKTPANGDGAVSTPAPIASRFHTRVSNPQSNTAGTVSARALVMLEFQRTSLEMSRQFLETQQNVMLAYLRGTDSYGDHQDDDIIRLVPNSEPGNGHSYSQPHRLSAAELQTQSSPAVPSQLVSSLTNSRSAPAEGSPSQSASAPPLRNSGTSTGAHATSSLGSIPRSTRQSTADYPAGAPPGTLINADPGFISNSSMGTSNLQPVQHEVSALTPRVLEPKSVAAVDIDSEQLIASLIEIVSERTGYPPEMLEPELDLEADLGIDSIKRVEILNSFRKVLPESRQKSLEGGIEQLASVKSLQGIMDWIRCDLSSTTSAVESTAAFSVAYESVQ